MVPNRTKDGLFQEMLRRGWSLTTPCSLCFRQTHTHPLQSFCEDLAQKQLIANTHPPALVDAQFASLTQLPSVVYAGFDPTSSSLHVGNLVVLNSLLRAARHGCEAFALVGGATALIGDPSGRNAERCEMHTEEAERNTQRIRSQIESIVDNFQHMCATTQSVDVVNNADWHHKMSSVEFIRMCRLFRVGDMLRMGAIKTRMRQNHGLPCSEFLYQVLQCYDWYHLSTQHQCFFQIGGSDQLGHLEMGHDYIRARSSRFAAGVCVPLLTDAAGNKLGKSVSHPSDSVWLSEHSTSPYAFFQFFRQKPDSVIVKLMRWLSLRAWNEVNDVLHEHNAHPGQWIAQEELAKEMTQLVHGPQGLLLAQQCSTALFKESLEDLESMPLSRLEQLFGAASIRRMSKQDIRTVGEVADRCGLDKQPGSELMRRGALSLNGTRFTDPQEIMPWSGVLLAGKNATLVCWAKRKYQLIVWTD